MTTKGRGADRAEADREVGLFRYALIRQAADPALTPRQRGELVRALAGREHAGPGGRRVRVSRPTLDRWIRAWRAGGFDALLPAPGARMPRTDAQTLELAAALKRENPARTAAQVAAVLAAHGGDAPSARTLQRHFARLGLNGSSPGAAPRAYGRFEADAPNVRWTGDALHGPALPGGKTYLFAFLDDHSRAVVAYRWGHREDELRLAAALRAGIATRGVPQQVYLDNGSAMVSSQLGRALAVLGIRLVHSRPGQPAGRGKVERFFRTVREQFLVEADPAQIADIGRLNELFAAWVETVYHHRVHSETGQAPLARYLAAGPPRRPEAGLLAEAFQWSAKRIVTKTATIGMHGNTYQVDPALVGRQVEVVFDPFDLTALNVRYQGRDMGAAVPHRIGRHVHPAAAPDGPQPAPPTGIDYLALLAQRHQRDLAAAAGAIDYAALAGAEGGRP
jgi:putative transposase